MWGCIVAYYAIKSRWCSEVANNSNQFKLSHDNSILYFYKYKSRLLGQNE